MPTPDPAVLSALRQMTFTYADRAPEAVKAMRARLVAVARAGDWITYSELTQGLSLTIPGVYGGYPFILGADGWSELERAILGSLLGRISADSYAEAGVFLSSVAISKNSEEPSAGFRDLARESGALRSSRPDDFKMFWARELAAAHEYYSRL
jgi:hypothetical protein